MIGDYYRHLFHSKPTPAPTPSSPIPAPSINLLPTGSVVDNIPLNGTKLPQDNNWKAHLAVGILIAAPVIGILTHRLRGSKADKEKQPPTR